MAALSILGAVLIFAGFIWFLIEAFKESIIWGLLCFFFPIISIVFFFMHLDKAWKPVALQFVGVALMMVGFFAFGEAITNLSQ